MNDKIVDTAYDHISSINYDNKRFRDRAGLIFNDLEMKQLTKALNSIEINTQVLEVGSGTGRFLLRCLSQGHEVHGLDPSESMIELSKEKTSEYTSIVHHLGEGQNLPFDDHSYGFVYTIRVLNQTISEEYALEVVREMHRVCRPKGYYLVEFVNKHSLSFFTRKGVKLAGRDFKKLTLGHKVVWKTGILFFSETVLRTVPKMILPFFARIDNFFSTIFPFLSTRRYILFQKTGE